MPRAEVLPLKVHDRPLAYMVREQRRRFGISLSVLRSATNEHTPIFDLPAALSGTELDDVLGRMCRNAGCCRMRFDLVPEGGHLFEAARALAGVTDRIRLVPAQTSPVVNLSGGVEAYLSGLSKKQRQNIRTGRNRMSKDGEFASVHLRGSSVTEAELLGCLEVEARGWKGREKSAIVCSKELTKFYVQVAKAAADEDQVQLSQLRFNGTVVAFNLLVDVAETSYLLKVGYDEDYARYSPGVVLFDEVIAESARRNNCDRIDMLDPVSSWKERWANATNRRYTLVYYPAGTVSSAVRLLETWGER